MDLILSRLHCDLEDTIENCDPIETLFFLHLNTIPELFVNEVFKESKCATIKYSRAIKEYGIDKQTAINKNIGELSLLIDKDDSVQKVTDL